MGLYITEDDVRVRLIGKVKFTDDFEDENRMHFQLLRRLINEAEGDVEHDLSPRYMAPFQTDSGGKFKELPERPTREVLRTLCELKAVVRVLETDFGRGTVMEGDKYAEAQRKRYEAVLEKILKRKSEDNVMGGWKYPPLPGLRLNYMNTEADDGYAGMVLTTGDSDGGYPATRINDPAEGYLNAKVEDTDGTV